MNRFFISKRQKCAGFSLAEALIVLMIICIIVLASVPVITKKRRNMDNSHGKYLCTLNSAGNYVEFYSRAAIGKEEDPDTWHEVTNSGYKDTVTWYNSDGQLLSKERYQCKFTPPPGARNFNVTVIGGGSGGRDGTSEYKELLSVTTPSSGAFTATEDNEYYNFILVSGGGGGGGSPNDWKNDSAGVGGGGGAGGVIRAEELHLVKNASYNYTVGGGGEGVAGDMHGCCRPNNTSHPRAKSGGDSSFKGSNNGETINFHIPGAQGGDSVGCSKRKCRGGGAGSGTPTLNITKQYHSAKGSVVAYGGRNGTEGYKYCSGPSCGVYKTVQGAQSEIDSFELDANNYPIKYSYGSGGEGRGYGNQAVQGGWGSSGALIISQLNKLYGNGGNAGRISSRFVPSIEGYLVASIPLAAKSNEAGKMVVITAYKNKTNNGILARAEGGALPDTNKEAPTDGEESPWTYKHAGAAAQSCSAVTNESSGYETVEREVQKCRKVGCELYEDFDLEYLKQHNTKTEIEGAGAVPVLPAGLGKWSSNEDEDAYLDMVFEALPLSNASGAKLDAYLKSLNIYYTDSSKAEGLINNEHADLTMYDNAYEFNQIGCFYDKDRLMYIKVCASSYTDKKYDKVWHEGRRHQTCPAAGDGQQFGAGGGGGTVGDIPGVFGKGGKGAPGAIIIEW